MVPEGGHVKAVGDVGIHAEVFWREIQCNLYTYACTTQVPLAPVLTRNEARGDDEALIDGLHGLVRLKTLVWRLVARVFLRAAVVVHFQSGLWQQNTPPSC